MSLLRTTLAAAVLLSPAAASAVKTPNAQDLSGTRAEGMANAFRGIVSTNEAIYLNLAGLALAPKYEIDLAYAFDRETDLSRWNGSITDSKTARLATGLAYTRLTGEGAEGEVDGSIVNLGFGLPISDRTAIGFGLKYLGFSDPEDTNAITADVGLLIRPVSWVSLGFAGYNLIDVHSPEAPMKAGGGIALGPEGLKVAFDTVLDFSRAEDTPITYHLGAEYLLVHVIGLRAGFEHRPYEGRNYATGGLGFVVDGFGLEAAYIQNTRSAESTDRTFSFTGKFFL